MPTLKFFIARALACALAGIFLNVSIAAPYLPASPTVVLLKLDSDTRSLSKQLATRRGATVFTSDDATLAAIRAREFISLGRSKHDERYFGYASAVLAPWNDLSIASVAPNDIALLRADIAQHQHRFSDSIAMLDTVIVRDTNNASARLMRASLEITLGQPQLAKRDCQQLLALRQIFVGTVCIAQAASLSGQLNASYQLVTQLLKTHTQENHTVGANLESSEQLSWGLGVAAEMAERRGDLEAATHWLTQALAVTPNDLAAQLQLADALLQRQQPQSVLDLLANVVATEPVLLRRALAAKQLHRTDNDADFTAWLTSVKQNEQIGLRLHLRELARGQLELLNAPQSALHTALQNWEVQRESIDARLLLAAAVAVGDQSVIRMVRQWQRELHIEDAGLSF